MKALVQPIIYFLPLFSSHIILNERKCNKLMSFNSTKFQWHSKSNISTIKTQRQESYDYMKNIKLIKKYTII